MARQAHLTLSDITVSPAFIGECLWLKWWAWSCFCDVSGVCALCGQAEAGRTVVMQFKLYIEHEVSWPHSLNSPILNMDLPLLLIPRVINSCCNTLTCAHPEGLLFYGQLICIEFANHISLYIFYNGKHCWEVFYLFHFSQVSGW